MLSQEEGDLWDFRAFETIDNLKKGMLMVRVFGRAKTESHYRIFLLDLIDRRRVKEAGKEERQVVRVLNYIDLDCESHFGREGERFLRTIKSEFGDIVLVITNLEVYEIEVDDLGEGFKLNLKPYRIFKSVASGVKTVKQLDRQLENVQE